MATATYYSPDGNPTVWEEGTQPDDYMTPEEWEAANPPDPVILAQQQIEDYQAQLTNLDQKSVRALRALETGTGTEEDAAFLQGLENQAEGIRAELAALLAEYPPA